MNDEGLTREQERSMLALLEQAALRDYPNPERIGCPGSKFLKRLAIERRSIDINDSALTHVARCSPCYREFVAYRNAAKRNVLTRRAALTAGCAVAAGVALVAVKWSWPQNSAANDHAEINLFNINDTRGTDVQPKAASLKPQLTRKRVDLTITLPFASPEGHYEVEVLHADGKPTGLNSSGTAHLLHGKTILRVQVNLSSLEPDAYQIGIRRIPFDWMPVSVEIR